MQQPVRHICFTFLLSALLALGSFGQTLPFGINMCGGEFGEKEFPGTYGVTYQYPSNTDIEYFYKKGFRLIDLPFKWERVQPKLGEELDAFQLKEMKRVVAFCESRGIKVILGMHNFGRYRINNRDIVIGSPYVTRADYNDVWKRLAKEFKGFKNIYGFDIMNEPHHMGAYSWSETAQQVIMAIRSVDARNAIIVPGENYSNPDTWVKYNDGLRKLKDPSDNLIFDAHCYFDRDYTGKYLLPYELNQVDEYVGVRRIKPFVDWLEKNNLKGMVGEFGVPGNDPRWLKTLDVFMRYISDLGMNGCYWAAGPLWSDDYALSVNPIADNIDKPQMKILKQYPYAVADEASLFVKNANDKIKYSVQRREFALENTKTFYSSAYDYRYYHAVASQQYKTKTIDPVKKITTPVQTDNKKDSASLISTKAVAVTNTNKPAIAPSNTNYEKLVTETAALVEKTTQPATILLPGSSLMPGKESTMMLPAEKKTDAPKLRK